MTKLDFDPARSAGIRSLLITTATTQPRQKHRRIWLGISLVAGLSVLGVGGAVAANYVLPGEDQVTQLDSPRTVTGSGTQTLQLGHVPAATDALETTLTCLDAGTLTWPDGSSMTCRTSDIGSTGTGHLAWTANQGSFRLTATEHMRWKLEYTFSHRHPTALQTNATGQSYGTDTSKKHPDLIAAEATNGRQGYISAADDAAASCGNVKTPAEAIKCNQDHAGKTETIPVYESDGVTQIGVFEIKG